MSRPIDSTHPAEPVTARHIEEAAKQKAVATSEKREFADVDVDADAKHLDNVGNNPNAALENPLQVRLRCSGAWLFSRQLCRFFGLSDRPSASYPGSSSLPPMALLTLFYRPRRVSRMSVSKVSFPLTEFLRRTSRISLPHLHECRSFLSGRN